MFPKTAASRGQTVYQPSIYTYTCRGAYHASSEFHQNKEGHCRGFRSRLELLSDMEMNTRKGALEDFTFWAAGGDVDGGYDLADENGGEILDPQTKSVLVSPALIYKEEAEYPKKKKLKNKVTDAIQKENPPAEDGISTVSSMLPEEELIQRQDWKCYGSTHVDYLLLTNPKTGREQIAAVAPRNHGLTIRKIQAEPGNNVTCIGLGWLSIVMDSVSLDTTDEKPIMKQNDEEPTAVTPEEVPPKPSPTTLASAKASAERCVAFSRKVAEHMGINAAWIFHTLQDDFPARTVASGQRIMGQVPVTIERTTGFMKKAAKKFWSMVDDEDDDDNSRGRRM